MTVDYCDPYSKVVKHVTNQFLRRFDKNQMTYYYNESISFLTNGIYISKEDRLAIMIRNQNKITVNDITIEFSYQDMGGDVWRIYINDSEIKKVHTLKVTSMHLF